MGQIGITLISLLAAAIFFDLKERRIPNWLNLFGLGAGLLLNANQGFAQFLHSLLGFGVGIGVLIIPFVLGWVGAGDVKLFGVVGALVGVGLVPRVFFYSGLVGGLLALLFLFARGVDLRGFSSFWNDIKIALLSLGRVMPEPMGRRLMQRYDSIPMGVAIGIGALIAFYIDGDGKWAGF